MFRGGPLWPVNASTLVRYLTHPATTTRIVPKDEAREALNQRLEEIALYLTQEQQTRRDQLFELLADLTDDDAASTEMDDLSDLGFDDLE